MTKRAEITECHFCSYKKHYSFLPVFLPLWSPALAQCLEDTQARNWDLLQQPCKWATLKADLQGPVKPSDHGSPGWKLHCERPWATTTKMSLTFRNYGRSWERKEKKETVRDNKRCFKLLNLGTICYTVKITNIFTKSNNWALIWPSLDSQSQLSIY